MSLDGREKRVLEPSKVFPGATIQTWNCKRHTLWGIGNGKPCPRCENERT